MHRKPHVEIRLLKWWNRNALGLEFAEGLVQPA
jgi:hypothetical protein